MALRMVLCLRMIDLGINMTIKERKELEDNGILTNHWYQVEYPEGIETYSSLVIKSISFPNFDSAYECYKKHEYAHLKEIEVWEYNKKQVVVKLLWNSFLNYFEVVS